jgi:hypothetical protein
MHHILLYLLKMLLCSGILYGYYRVALYNERFHQWNRFYLLAAMLLSVTVPLIEIPLVAEKQPIVMVYVMETINWTGIGKVSQQSNSQSWPVENNVIILVLTVSAVLLIKLVSGFIAIIRQYKAGSKTAMDNVSIILTAHEAAPYSFFRWLFWRKNMDPHTPQGHRMLQHELAHIHQHHTIDKIFTEVILIFFWMNPIFWLMRKEIYVIHEFLADSEAIEKNNGAALAEMILQSVNMQPAPLLTNPFFTSQIKRRLIMITTSKKPMFSYFRRVTGLFCIAITSLLLGVTIQKTQAQTTGSLPTTYDGKKIKEIDIDRTKGIVKLTLENDVKVEKTIKQAGEEKILPEKILNPQKKNEITEAEKQKASEWMNKTMVQIKTLPAEEQRAYLVATTTTDEEIIMGAQNGMSSGVNGNLMPTNGQFGINTAFKKITTGTNPKKPIYIFDGKIVKPEAIESLTKKVQDYNITVFNGDRAEELYGKDARYGVVTILPADSKDYSPIKPDVNQGTDRLNIKFDLSKAEASSGKNINLTELAQDALIIYNGEEISKEKLVEIDVNTIESVDIIKDDIVIKQYGEKGKNGVMKIISKNNKVPTK